MNPTAASDFGLVEEHLRYSFGKQPAEAKPFDYFRALSLALRQPILDGAWRTEERFRAAAAKRVHYVSMEFLVGRLLRSTISNLGCWAQWRDSFAARGVNLDDALEAEPDPGLGNGGLGRLAACFLESLASLDLPATGYGINYDYGLFRQEIRNGAQWEVPDVWLNEDSPWLIARPDETILVPIYGHVEEGLDPAGQYNPMWLDWKLILGVPYDLPVAGHGGRTVQFLRLFSARASDEFDMGIFNSGDYIKAVQQKIASENVSKVLYPSDSVPQGRELRLVQEYFLVACSLRDMIDRFSRQYSNIDLLPDKVAMQLNDTHPALAVADLMRLLIDEKGLAWEKAWEFTQAICGYTNHTLLPEALEKWPVDMLARVLPRHLQIIFEINRRFLDRVRAQFPGDEGRVQRVSLIEETPQRQVRMANLAIAGSHAVNGVSALHSRLITESLVPDFAAIFPGRFQNKTNGITHRRWLLEANPELSALITQEIGDGWVESPEDLFRLLPRTESSDVQQAFLAARLAAKRRLAQLIRKKTRLEVDPTTIFDVQIKRIHEYKRQLLNVLALIHDYLRIVEDGVTPPAPRTAIFAGKAAPGYYMAKLIIRLIHGVAYELRRDKRVDGWLKVVFLPDYRVSLAERIIPAADLSEQISTAGMEASGTGNMKLALNGALTVGTLDGANVEIKDAAGAENVYIFGLRVEQVEELKRSGYGPWQTYQSSTAARRVMDALGNERMFSPTEPGLFRPIYDKLMNSDPYFHLADLDAYLEARERAAQDYLDTGNWARRSLINVASMGWFSSDRTINEYARDIWGIKPVR